jgi:hypothetical protein
VVVFDRDSASLYRIKDSERLDNVKELMLVADDGTEHLVGIGMHHIHPKLVVNDIVYSVSRKLPLPQREDGFQTKHVAAWLSQFLGQPVDDAKPLFDLEHCHIDVSSQRNDSQAPRGDTPLVNAPPGKRGQPSVKNAAVNFISAAAAPSAAVENAAAACGAPWQAPSEAAHCKAQEPVTARKGATPTDGAHSADVHVRGRSGVSSKVYTEHEYVTATPGLVVFLTPRSKFFLVIIL